MSVESGVGAAVKTYLQGSPAQVSIDADMQPTVRPAPVDQVTVPVMTEHPAAFLMEDYMVLEGVPTGRPELEARHFTRVGMGEWTWTDVPPRPWEINTGAALRWLPTDTTFAPGAWQPSVGGGMSLVADPQSAPYLDDGYSFEVRGGDEVALPAVVFSGDAWMQLNDVGWSAHAFTVAIAAVFHPNDEGPLFGILQSYTPATADPNSPSGTPSGATDWGLRYRSGIVELYAGTTVLSHTVSLPIGRPVVLVVAMEPTVGRLLVADRTKSTRSFATSSYSLFDVQLLLGRTASGASSETAQMDVLEMDFFDHALSFEEMAGLLHDLNSLYGVVSA